MAAPRLPNPFETAPHAGTSASAHRAYGSLPNTTSPILGDHSLVAPLRRNSDVPISSSAKGKGRACGPSPLASSSTLPSDHYTEPYPAPFSSPNQSKLRSGATAFPQNPATTFNLIPPTPRTASRSSFSPTVVHPYPIAKPSGSMDRDMLGAPITTQAYNDSKQPKPPSLASSGSSTLSGSSSEGLSKPLSPAREQDVTELAGDDEFEQHMLTYALHCGEEVDADHKKLRDVIGKRTDMDTKKVLHEKLAAMNYHQRQKHKGNCQDKKPTCTSRFFSHADGLITDS